MYQPRPLHGLSHPPHLPPTHTNGKIKAAACLNGDETAELAKTSARWMKPSSEAPSLSAGVGMGLPQLVHPPQLPSDDDKLGLRDEEDLSKMEAFLVQVLVCMRAE